MLATVGEAVVVLDSERRLVAASPAAAQALGDVTPGRRLGEDAEGAEPGPLVLFLDAAAGAVGLPGAARRLHGRCLA